MLDEEQRKDVEYLKSFPNKAGRIRECVRAMRMGVIGHQQLDMTIGDIAIENMDEATDDEAIDLLTS